MTATRQEKINPRGFRGMLAGAEEMDQRRHYQRAKQCERVTQKQLKGMSW